MAALTEDKDMELALIRVLLSLVEEPLGISVSRLTGLLLPPSPLCSFSCVHCTPFPLNENRSLVFHHLNSTMFMTGFSFSLFFRPGS